MRSGRTIGTLRKNQGPTWRATVQAGGLSMVPKQIVNRRVRPMQGAGGERLRLNRDGAALGSVGVLLRPNRAAKRALLEQRGDWGLRKARVQ